MDGQHLAEVGIPAFELQVPHFHRLLQAELLALDFREGGEHVRAAEQNLALVTDARAYEQVFRDVNQIVIRNDGTLLVGIPFAYFDILACHPPQAAGEPRNHAVFRHVLDGVLHSEKISILHRKAHVIDAVLLDVGEAPVHLLLGNLVKCGLLDLNHEVLAILRLGHRDVVEAPRLHVKLAARLTHAHKYRVLWNGWNPYRLLARRIHCAVHGIHRRHVRCRVLAAHAQHKVRRIGVFCVVCLSCVGIGHALDTDYADSVVQRKHVGITYRKFRAGTA